MKEEFLQYIWANSLFQEAVYYSSEGKSIRIIDTGSQNFDSGADFFCARVEIDGVIIVGNAEIHHKGSDWYRHDHHNDPAYDNVILSVVEIDDREVYNSQGRKIETLVINYNRKLWDEYVYMQGLPTVPRCYRHLSSLQAFGMELILAGYAVDRLERKSNDVRKILTENRNDWEACFYRMLLRYWSGNVNADAFSLLAQHLDYKKILRCGDSLFRIEALLFGTAGLLEEEVTDEYARALKQEYAYQASKFHLNRMKAFQWRFMRVRPMGFPTIRIALLAGLMYRFHFLFSTLIETEELKEVKKSLDVTTSSYWETHYRFGIPSPLKVKKMGDNMKNVILINAVIPLLFVYGKERGEERFCEKALNWLDELQAERNQVVRQWEKHGIVARTALQSQALLQVKSEYCDKHRCLHCKIGNKVFQGINRTRSI